jgi:HK97 family phage major capsid protein
MGLDKYLEERKAKTELVTFDNLPVRVKKGADRELEVLAAPYGGHIDGKDADGEYFSEKTDFYADVGDKRPAMYLHGKTPRGTTALKPSSIGKGEVSRRDTEGLWMDVKLGDGELADRVWQAAQIGKARASSGAVNYLVRTSKDGEILSWPLAEISLFDGGQGRRPANELVQVSLKSMFDNAGIELPESFVKSGELETELVQGEDSDKKGDGNISQGDIKMTEQIIDYAAIAAEAAAKVRAELAAEEAEKAAKAEHDQQIAEEAYKKGREEAEAEAKAQQKAWEKKPPAYNKTVGKNAESEGSDEFINWMRTGDDGMKKVLKPADLSGYQEAGKALQVGSDTEGGYLAPDDFYGDIVAKRDQMAWTRNVGINFWNTDKKHVDVPIEDTSMTKFAVTAEEAAYSDSDPIFGNVEITVYKFTRTNKFSEELLADEDSNLMNWYTNSLARAMALTESYYVAIGSGSSQPQGALVGGTAGLTFDSADQITADEIPELFYKLGSGYRRDAVWLMNEDTEGYLRKLRDANDFAFDMRGANLNVSGDWKYETFYAGRPIYTETGMSTIGTGLKTVLIGNWQYYTFAEHTNLAITRNPYLYEANGQIGFFARQRFGGAVTQAEAFQYATQA